jgi:glycine cleavage system H protein
MASNIPADLLYTEHDEWVRQVKTDVVAVGITDFAQDALGEIVHVEMPSVGDEVEAGNPIAEIESVKAVAELYAPVSGEIIEINEEIDDSPDAVNKDAYASWLFKIKMSEPDELSNLLDAGAYQTKLDEA